MVDSAPQTAVSPVAAAAAFLAGPAMAVLYETGLIPRGLRGTLWPLLVIVGAAAVGFTFGAWLGRRGPRLLGAVIAVPNMLVLAYYGFFLLFFAWVAADRSLAR